MQRVRPATTRRVIAGLLVLLAACNDPSAPDGPVLVGDFGFLYERDDQFHLVDGTGAPIRTVLPDGVDGFMPDVSHDGARITFIRPVQVGTIWRREVATIGIDGAGLRVLSSAEESGMMPRWSFDGAAVAYSMSSWGSYDYFDDLVIRVDGASDVAPEHVLEGNFDGVLSVTWSPDGGQLAYEHSSDGLWVVGRDGAGPRQLTTGRDIDPDWSPDGTRIAFSRLGDQSVRLCILTLSSGAVNCLPLSGWASMPRWSPDGQWLAYIGDTGGLFTVKANGSDPVQRIPGSQLAGSGYDWVRLRGVN